MSFVALFLLTALPRFELKAQTILIDGVQRRFLYSVPDQTQNVPLVFVFHGHGGNMRSASRSFRIHEVWPEAAVVYMEGLPTKTKKDPDGTRNGWGTGQSEDAKRDYKFFEETLKWIEMKGKIDRQAVFATGHSNGGGFTYNVWNTHQDLFLGIAPSAAIGRAVRNSRPMNILHITGDKDQTVDPKSQAETVERLRLANHSESKSKEWVGGAKKWESPSGKVIVHYVYSGTHKYPSEAPELIVKFFKELLQSR
jgi:polyhydroxybutyrate depolymerase